MQDLINLRAEHLRQIAEFQFAGALVFLAEMAAGGLVGVEHLQVAPDDDARAAEFAQHVRHHLVVAGQLVVQPDVAEGQADLFEQMENQFQFGVDQRFAGDAAVENGDADNGFAVEHGHGDLGAEQFKFLLRLGVGAGLVAVAAENPAQPDQLAADAGIERQFKMFEQSRGEADGGGGAQTGGFLPEDTVSPSGRTGRFRKMAARLTLKISRRNSRNCLSMASAFRECVRMDEKSRSTFSVCDALATCGRKAVRPGVKRRPAAARAWRRPVARRAAADSWVPTRGAPAMN